MLNRVLARTGEGGLERTEGKNVSLIHILLISTSLTLLCEQRETQAERSTGRRGTMLGWNPETGHSRCSINS